MRTSCGVKLAGGPIEVGEHNRNKKIWVNDSGIDKNHPDLKVNEELSVSFIPDEPNPTEDFTGHGTHCSGIAAGRAIGDGFYGMNGVSSGAELVSVKVLNKFGEGSLAYLKRAFEHILVNGERGEVVMVCLGASGVDCWDDPYPEINRLITIMTVRRGMFLVMSAGNDFGSANDNYPGCFSYPHRALTVAAVDFNCNFITGFAPYSNYGTAARWSAPGTSVFSTFPGGKYEVMSGTSMACALVAGIIHARGDLPTYHEYITYLGLDYKLAIL